jgi:hypothetical protein
MKKLAIIALLVIVLIGCAPIMPARNQTSKTTEKNVSENKTAETPAVVENSTVEMNKTEDKTVDTRDLPKKEVTEGDFVSFPNLRAVDPDGDPIKYTFSTPLDEKGRWQTKEGDAGEHIVTITASDGSNIVSQQVLLVVKSKNKPPVIELEQPVEATEGETVTLEPTITDEEGDTVKVSYSGWMTSASKETGFDDAGNHKVVITAEDSKGARISTEVIVSVANADRSPMLADIPTQTIKEGQKVTVKPSAKDPDGDNLTYSFEFPLDDKGQWETKVGDAGDYEVKVTASDGELSAEKVFVLTVQSVNKAPVIELDSPVTVKEGETVKLEPTITDAEGDEVRVSYSGWMNSGMKTTGYEDSGEHHVSIFARDSAGNEAKLDVTVVVEDENRAPIFGAGSFS